MNTLNPYMVHDGDPGEGAVLVFAATGQQARVIGFDEISGWLDARFIDIRAKRMRNHLPYLLTFADQAKLAAGIPHISDDIPTCVICERWGAPPLTDKPGCAFCGGTSLDDL